MSDTRQCRHCGKRRTDVHTAWRQGGGNYRRPHRSYRSSLCVPCARGLVPSIGRGVLTISRWSVRDVRDIAVAPTAEEVRDGSPSPTLAEIIATADREAGRT